MTIDAAILDELRAMALRTAPELREGGLYVVAQPPCIATPRHCDAYAVTPRVTGAMRDHLKSLGQWEGFGPAIVMVDDCESTAAIHGLFVHELAHVTPAPPAMRDYEPSAAELKWQSCEFAKLVENAEPMDVLPPWHDHDADFIRRALHLHARAVRAGWPLTWASLSIGAKYGLSHEMLYALALGEEPFRLRNATFAEIMATPVPPAFDELWRADIARWNNTTRTVREEAAA